LGLGNKVSSDRLVFLGQCFWVVDLNQHSARRDILTAIDGDLGDAAVHSCCHIETRRVHLALN
jgi:hypothetical protein